MVQVVSGGGNGITGSTSAVTFFDPVTEAGDSGAANGLLGGSKWGTGIGNGVTLTTSFFSSSSVYIGMSSFTAPLGKVPFSQFTPAEVEIARGAMAAVAAVSNVKFLEIADTAGQTGDIRWASDGNLIHGGYASLPYAPAWAGDIFIAAKFATGQLTEAYESHPAYLPWMMQHELGHALGLLDAGVTGYEGWVPLRPGEDAVKYTVMGIQNVAFDPRGLMLNDILALQYLYGINWQFQAGDNVYRWQAGTPVFETIWDGGGWDTIDASNQDRGVVINLNPGQWSEIGTPFFDVKANARDNLTIAYNCTIEGAIGSAFDDVIIGNDVDNRLDGGAGNDSLDGGAGNDTLIGGGGNDLMTGGSGIDTADYSAIALAGGIQASLTSGKVVKALSTRVDTAVTGRYIRIYHNDTVDANVILSLTGLKVYAGGVDVAAGRPGMAGADVNPKPDIALYHNQAALTDSVLGGAWNGMSTPATSNLAWAAGSSKAYFELDLGAQYTIDEVNLWGRADMPKEGSNLRVYISSTAFTSSATAYADLAANTAVKRFDVATVDGQQRVITAATSTDTLSGIENLVGTAFNDSLTGDAGDNVFYGGEGNDSLYGQSGNDTVQGGVGNDTLDGGAGNDRYLFSQGDGQDFILDASGIDRIVFGGGITADMLGGSLSGGQAKLSLASGESVSFAALALGNYAVEQFEFADGTVKDAGWLGALLLNGAPAGTTKTLTLNEDSSYAITGADLGLGNAVDPSAALASLYNKLTEVRTSANSVNALRNNLGKPMDCLEIQQESDGSYVGVYQTVVSGDRFSLNLATSSDLKSGWTERTIVDSNFASQGALRRLVDGRYLLAYEKNDTGHPYIQVRLYDNLTALLGNTPMKTFNTPLLPGTDAQGTPNFRWIQYDGNPDTMTVEMGFHFYRGGRDYNAIATLTNFSQWSTQENTKLNTLLDVYANGNMGDRTFIVYEGRPYTLVEAQTTQGDFSSFRLYLYDELANILTPLPLTTQHGNPGLGNSSLSVVSDASGNMSLFMSMYVFGPVWVDTGSHVFVTPLVAGDSTVNQALTITPGLSAARLDLLPQTGSLKLNGVAVTPGQVVSATDLAAGRLVFTPGANAHGDAYAGLVFSVPDKNGAFDTSPYNALSLNVAAVNDLPTGVLSLQRGGTAISNTSTVQQGDILAVTNTLADMDGMGTLSYQWQSSVNGTSWSDIAGATATSFTLTPELAGRAVRATASYTDGDGTRESVGSLSTLPINRLTGTAGADTLVGNTGDNVFVASAGNDTLNGLAGNDTVDYSASGMAGGINASLALNAQGVQRAFKMTGGSQVNMGVSGRYIRIYHSDAVAAGSLLSLTGLKVFAGGVDVAAGRPGAAGADKNALDSIALYSNQAALTDGVLGGPWNGGNTAATSNLAWAGGSKAYIELDLGGQYVIDSLGLWGRADAPLESGNLRVYVSGTAFTSSATAYADLAANTAVKRFDVAAIDTAVSTVFTDTLSGIENLVGTALADVLTGDAGNNTLNGLAGNDALNGDAGNDTLAGGAGTDALNGGAGDDRYLFNLGDGQDTVADASGNDRIVFGAGITVGQIGASMSGGQVTLTVNGGSGSGSDSVRFAAPAFNSYAIEQFEFADGSVKDAAWLSGLLNTAPAGANKTLALSEDASYTVSVADLGFADANAGDSLSAVRIDSLPAAGSLKLNGVNVTAAQVVSTADLAAGLLKFSPAANASGSNYASFSFSVKDQYGAFDATLNTLSFNVAAVNDVPTGAVTIGGTPTQNQVLTASHSLADADGLGTVSYQWLANGTAIAGATSATLTLGQAQVGKAISVKAGYTDGFNTVESVTSVATTGVANVNDAPAGAVTISGTPTQNQVLTVSHTLTDVDGLGVVSYQWLANGTAIAGATNATLTLGQAQVGKAISVKASYTDGFGTAESKTSIATSTVANVNDAPTGAVTISGTPAQNQVLTASNTLADVDGMNPVSYQWLANGTAIAGATGATLTLGQAQAGKDISVRAGYTDGGGTAEGASSAAVTFAGRVVGTSGADTLAGTAGADRLEGLAGNDSYTVNHAGDVVVELAGEGTDSVQAGISYALGANVENLVLTGAAAIDGAGNALNNVITGNAAANVLNGGAGDDQLSGGAGNDVLDGGDGDDLLIDTVGGNTLKGGLGSDTIVGRGIIEGGQGDDTIIASDMWSGDTYVFNLGDGKDTIDDYGVSNAMGFGGADYADTLRFGAGVLASDVTVSRAGPDMVFRVNAGDQIAVKGWFDSSSSAYRYIEQVRFADGTTWDVAKIKAMVTGVLGGTDAADTLNGWEGVDRLSGLAGNDSLNGYAGNDILDGGEGDDMINAGAGDDQVFGGLGNDVIDGGAGYDVIDGGAGDDTIDDAYGFNTIKGGLGNDTIIGRGIMEGGQGDDTLIAGNSWMGDTYVFKLGDGKDTIAEYGLSYIPGVSGDPSLDDVLQFGAGIAASAVAVSHIGNDMVFKVNAADQVTARNWYIDPSRYIEQLQFSDGTVWTVDTLRGMDISATGTAGADTITGWDGKDVMDGGAGNDTLNGLAGNDTYLAYRGMGQDRIAENDATAGNTDVLSFGADISADQLWFRQQGNNLEVSVIGTADKAIVQDWYLGNAYHVEQIKSGNGKLLLDTQVENLVQAMASFAPPAMGQTSLTASQQTALAPALAANWH